jgi:hypothetical protein
MFRILGCILAMATLSGCLVHSKTVVEGQPAATPSKLDGVYELVSESTELTKPRKASYAALSSDWAGRWQFQNGYYSRIMMKRRRNTFFSGKVEDLGFESFGGRYEIEGANIRLIQDYAVHPFAVGRSALKTYRIDGDTLTLIEKLQPYLEDPTEGTVTTVLRRVD